MLQKIIPLARLACLPLLGRSKADRIDELIDVIHDNRAFSGAALVAEDGKVIYSKGFGLANMEWNVPNAPDTKFRIGSLTKQFTACLILQLIQAGKLGLDTRISDVLPDYPKKTGDRITIHQLLTHTSGLPDYTAVPEYFSDAWVRRTMKPREIVDLFKDRKMDFEPGTRWAYSNSGYIVLGVIIEKLTGKPYERVLQENILDPAGMADSGYDHMETVLPRRASGYDVMPCGYRNCDFVDMSSPCSAGAMFSTVGDLFKWDRALAGGSLLSEDSKRRMFTGYCDTGTGLSYGYGWMTKFVQTGKNDSTRIFVHGGGIYGFNTVIVRQIERNNCIILLNNTPSGGLGAVTDRISDILYGVPFDMPKRPAANRLSDDTAVGGIERAVKRYAEAFKRGDRGFDFAEPELTRLGHQFLSERRTAESLAVFRLDTEVNPDSSRAFDGLGAALLAADGTTGSVAAYTRSLALNPKNDGAVNVLKSLKADVSGCESVDPESYELYSGRYRVTPQLVIDITTENGRIYAQPSGSPRFERVPESATRFSLTVGDATAEFVREGDKVPYFILTRNGQRMRCTRVE
jgi:CubicO group peptidase (beta-lactamase class C family)